MDIKQAKEALRRTYLVYTERDEFGSLRIPAEQQRPLLLMGPPGVGKTAILSQLAEELGAGLVAYTMTHHTRQSALGLPVLREKTFGGKTYTATEYTMSEILASVYERIEKTGVPTGILFLDEINCVSETLMPAMLQLLQSKQFGTHALPEGWVIAAAGNPPAYNESARTFDTVTMDRVRLLQIEADYHVWRDYAHERGLHPAVLSYLELNPEHFFCVERHAHGRSFVTARGWEDLAEAIALYEEMGKTIGRDLIGQFLRDDDIADSFSVYYNLFDKYRSDYQIMNILAGGAGLDIINRARGAEFDERVALLGLMLDAVANSCAHALEQEEVVIELRDILRDAKPKLLEGAAVDDTVGVVTSAREQSLARKVASGTAKPSFERKEGLVIAKLKRLMEQCRLANTVVGEVAFETISNAYRDEVNAIDPLVKTADAQMTNAIKFIEEAWGNGREMLVAIAELTTRQATTQFIAHYGNEEYYAHNDELQVDEHRRSLSERVRTLDINAEEAMQPGETKAVDAQTIAEYYGGKQFEYGFASMSKMTLPDAARLKGKTVLDVACRRGKGCFKFSAKVGGTGHVIGVDWSPSYIEEAIVDSEKAWRKNGLKANNMSFKVAYPEDLMQAGIGESTVDVVYINNVMTLLYDQGKALEEFCRVLKPGGLLICETIVSDVTRDDAVVQKARGIGNSIQAARPEDELLALMKAAGFKDVEVIDSYSVEADRGFTSSTVVETVPSTETVRFEAIALNARK